MPTHLNICIVYQISEIETNQYCLPYIPQKPRDASANHAAIAPLPPLLSTDGEQLLDRDQRRAALN